MILILCRPSLSIGMLRYPNIDSSSKVIRRARYAFNIVIQSLTTSECFYSITRSALVTRGSGPPPHRTQIRLSAAGPVLCTEAPTTALSKGVIISDC